MADPLEHVAYLARSENRVEVLSLLAEGPRDRDELQAATGASRVTVGRMLGELENRDWVRRVDREYRLTHAGRIVAEDLERLLRTTGTAEKLGEVERLLPVESFDFDLRRLAGADVYRPQRSDPNAPMRRLAEVVAGADRVQVVAPAVSPVVIRNHQQRLLDAGDHEASVTLSADAVDVALADPELRSWFRGMLETDRYDLYRYDGTIPLNLVVPDETVFVVLFDEEAGGGVHSMVESTHESVLRWAEETIERYRSDAERVGPEAFASPN